ncbi:MAG: tetratricopeptide repeat protein [Candidatus Eiseniibacteriota bacterium]
MRESPPRRSVLIVLAAVLPFLVGWSFFDPFHEHVEKGNRKAKEKAAAEEALGHYGEAARVSPGSAIPDFNRGIVLSQEGRVEEARDAFLGAAAAEDSPLAADALYNLGNTLLEAEQFEPAVEAYLQSLDLDPADADARRNLEIALRRLQQQQQQQQQEEQQEDEEGEQGQQQEQQQDQEQSDQEETPSDQGEQEEQPQEQQQELGRMTREDAERLLNAIQSDELKVLQQLQDEEEQDEGDGNDW